MRCNLFLIFWYFEPLATAPTKKMTSKRVCKWNITYFNMELLLKTCILNNSHHNR